VLALDCGLEFDPAREEEFFAALPARPAVFLVEPREASAHPYLVRTADLRRRAERLLRAPEAPSKRLNLREFAARVRYRLTGSTFEQNLVLYEHARALYPRRYRDWVRVRAPALLKVNLASEYPRCYVTRRILSDGGFYFGPFPTRRAAEAFANGFLDLFKVRRCQIKIRRDPSFPGCIYSEMKMCLAPCFAGCSKEEYDVEVSRVAGFLGTSGAALVGELERERESASESLDFERAAALHRKIEKVAEVLRSLPELARKLDELDAAILQPAAEENTVAIFAVRGGRIADPFLLRFGELASQPRSVEEILRQNLEPQLSKPQLNTEEHQSARKDSPPSEPVTEASQGFGSNMPQQTPFTGEELGEHLALLSRWYYSRPRQGEIFFRQADWPYRRIIRACSRLLAPQTSLPFVPDSQPGPGSAPGI
jgi:excinuclease UvrABC nuclease subunit